MQDYEYLFGRAETLSKEEVVKLLENPTQENKEKLISNFIKFVPFLIQRYNIKTASKSMNENLRDEIYGECIIAVVRAVNNLDATKPVDSIYSYIYTSIVNVINTFIEKIHCDKRKHVLNSINLEDVNSVQQNDTIHNDFAEDVVLIDESIDLDFELMLIELKGYIDSLEDEVDRLILTKMWFEGRTLKEVSEIVNLSTSGVHVRLIKHREKVRKLLSLERG